MSSELIEQMNSLIISTTHITRQLNYMKKILETCGENETVVQETDAEFKRIRRSYETTVLGSAMFPFGVEYIYVWELEGGKYYVGWSENLSRRMDEHMTSEGAIWTRQYAPVAIREIMRGDKALEKTKTLGYMKKYGFENVRGSFWCKSEYKVIPEEVQRAIS